MANEGRRFEYQSASIEDQAHEQSVREQWESQGWEWLGTEHYPATSKFDTDTWELRFKREMPLISEQGDVKEA